MKTTALGKIKSLLLNQKISGPCSSADLNNWTIGTRPIALKPLLGTGIFQVKEKVGNIVELC